MSQASILSAPPVHAVACPIDFQHLDRQTMGDAELARELLVLYFGLAPGLMREIAGASDGRVMREAAHRLTGSARAIGALMVANAASQLEVNLMSRDFQRGFPGERDLIANVSRAVDEAQSALSAHLSVSLT